MARLCLLLANSVNELDEFADDERLVTIWNKAVLRLQAAADQQAAMIEELASLAAADPRQISVEQIWVLIRALKVQGGMLQMYTGAPRMDPQAAYSTK